MQTFVNLAWAAADVLIIYTFLRYGRKELPGFVSRPMFIAWSVLLFATAYIVQWLFIAEFGWADAPSMRRSCRTCSCRVCSSRCLSLRGGPRGQSVVIAVAKWIGTLAPTIAFGALAGSAFILGIGILCSVLDLAYLSLSFGRAWTCQR